MAMDLKFLISAKDEATAVLNKVGSSFQKLESESTGAFSKLKGKIGEFSGALGALGAAFGAVGVGAWIKGAINEADEIGKMSQKIGIAVDELSALKYAAELSDVSFEQLGVGMKQFSRNIIEASEGSKEQSEAFEKLGVSLDGIKSGSEGTYELMERVAGKFAGMENGAAKTALAMKLFGKSGADLIPLLNSGEDGLKAMREEADRLGIVLDERTAKAAEEFNDNLTRLKNGVKGASLELAETMLPTLLKLEEWLGKAAPALSTGLGYALKGIVKAFETVGSTIGFFVAEAVTGFEAINRAAHLDFKGAWGQVKAMKDIQVQYWSDLKKTWTDWSDSKQTQKKTSVSPAKIDSDVLEKAAKEEEKQLKELQQSYKEHAQKIIETEQKRWQKLEEGEKKYASLVKSALSEKIKEIDELKNRLTDITNTLDEIDKKRAEKLAPGIDPNLDAYDKYQAQIALLRKQEEAASNILDLDKRASALTQIYDAWSQITEEITVGNDTIITQQDVLERSQVEMDRLRSKISAPFEEQKAAAEQSRSVLERMYDGAIQKASEYRQQVENLATMLDNLKDKDVTINFKATGLDQLQGIASLMSGTSSSSGGLKTYASLDDWWDSVHAGSGGWQTVTEFAGADNYDGWLASGGPVKPFGTYVVGEKGPEVLRMGSQGGTVIPNNKLGGITITGGLNLTLPNVTNQSTARDLARELYPELQRLSKNTRSA